jgi:hypothetical protein
MSTTIRRAVPGRGRVLVALVLTAFAAAVVGPAAPATAAVPRAAVVALCPSDPPVIRG